MEDVRFDLQEETDYINSVNQSPVTFIQEYAVKRKLWPRYDLVYNGLRQLPYKFVYRLELDGYEVLGEGSSKKEARQATAGKLFEKLIADQPDLLVNEFKELNIKNVVSPFEKTIKENFVGQLNGICCKLQINLPIYEEIREEGKDHAKMFTINCRISSLCEEAIHKTKQQAKHLAAQQMMARLLTMDEKFFTIPKNTHIFGNNANPEFMKVKKNACMDEIVSNYHLLFKQTKFPNTETLDQLVQQYNSDGELNLDNPLDVLNKVVEECEMSLSKTIVDTESGYCCILSIISVYPSVTGLQLNYSCSLAEKDAAKDLLTNMCILYS
ncbi:RISC-loading complex subunit TARBP2-like [Adelges cooleyi]|uniref:RISC-loading complex subunit TARBP2-like n=1 Tax=Adelges cooleyi TaxID=133065 RepID=UPI0021807217|nr:RISC-loading complex subunit TARBP2-like [Adelges cooleyi]